MRSASPKFAGGLSELQRERDRLLAVLKNLQQHQAAVERTPQASEDPRGEVLGLLLRWRARRRRALEAEVRRLEALIQAAQSADGARKMEV
jgi:hypothetical protein